jgi:hypothetical protein
MAAPLKCPDGTYSTGSAIECTLCSGAADYDISQCPRLSIFAEYPQVIYSVVAGLGLFLMAHAFGFWKYVRIRQLTQGWHHERKPEYWLILALLFGPFVWLIWTIYTWGLREDFLEKNPDYSKKYPGAFSKKNPDATNSSINNPDQSLQPLLSPEQRNQDDDASCRIIPASVPAQGSPSGAVSASPLPPSPPASSPSLPAAASSNSPNPKFQEIVAAIKLPSVPLTSLSSQLTHDQFCGTGDSCIVYKVQYKCKDAAAKIFLEHKKDLLQGELRSLNLVAHDNIVRLLAKITDNDSQPIGFIMEYLPESLERAMDKMTLRQAVHAMNEAALGVAVAHDALVVHSDIKPGNILCSDDFSVVKLADFGLARLSSSNATQASKVRGTPLYIAPELQDEPHTPTILSDIFSFGMAIWQASHLVSRSPCAALLPARVLLTHRAAADASPVQQTSV